MRFLIIFIFLLSNSFANEVSDIKNIVINKELKKYDELTFLDDKNRLLDINEFRGNLILLNFWATWCAPCKEEMPHLDELQKLIGIEVFPINIEKINKQKVEIFFKSLEIKNLQIFFDNQNNLVNMFSLRGIPTTIILNKEKKEIARIIGFADFSDQVFIDWLNSMKELK